MTEKDSAKPFLASTARWTASVRAQESSRPDSLFQDPYAAALAGEEGMQWVAQRTADKVLAIVLRTRYFDDFLQRVTQENALRQVVFLAAGLDTRAFRLAWPTGTQIFELDQPEVLRYKEQILNAAGASTNCTRHVIEQDLTTPWQDALVQSGMDPNAPTLWLLEGFLFYLPGDQVKHILEAVSQLAAPGSWLGFDIINSIMLTHPLTKAWVDMQAAAGAPWIGTLDDPVEYLARLGWQVSLSQAGQPEANHGRWSLPVLPTSMPAVPHNWYVTAHKVR
jgi:methyltransferase (TIGR00027 family)